MVDFNGPLLTGLVLPSLIDISEGSKQITVTATAEDGVGGTGVDRVVVLLDKNVTFDFGAFSNFSVGASYNSTDSFKDGTPTKGSTNITLTNATSPGTYNVSQVWVYDVAGNMTTYSTSQLAAMGIKTSFTVTGTVTDNTGPRLTSLVLPSSVDISNGSKQITVTATAEDGVGGTGVDRVVVLLDKNVTFDFGAFSNFSVGASYNSTDSFKDGTPTKGSTNITLTNATSPGTYNVSQVWVYDVAGNMTTYSTSQLAAMGIKTSFTVTGTVTDNTGPRLTSLVLPSSVDISNGSKQITVTATAEDGVGGTGVDRVVVLLDKNVTFDFGAFSNFSVGASYNSTDSFKDGTPTKGSTNITLTNATSPGTYNVSQVWVYDVAGNMTTYSTSQLAAMGIKTSFSVTDGDTSAPTGGSRVFLSQAVNLNNQIVLTMNSNDLPSGPVSFELSFTYLGSNVSFKDLTLAGTLSATISASSNGDSGSVKISGTYTPSGGTSFGNLTFDAAGSGIFDITISNFKIGNYAVAISDPPPFDYKIVPRLISGSKDNDLLLGSSGNQQIDGGTGLDVVAYVGERKNFQIAKSGLGYNVSDILGDQGSDTLLNIERVQFYDINVALDGTAAAAYRLYQASFNRKPDASGLGYWIAQCDKGLSLYDAAWNFINSAEFKTLYGSNVTNGAFITALYDNVLHRAPDQTGFNYWNNLLSNGTVSRHAMLAEFSESPENQAQVIGSIQNGIEYQFFVS
jgi:hypothetical protein